MVSGFFWSLQSKHLPVFWKVWEAMYEYDKLLAKTLNKLGRSEAKLDPRLLQLDIDVPQQTLLNRVPDAQTKEEVEDLANDIAVYLVNAESFRKFVGNYWEIVTEITMEQFFELHGAAESSSNLVDNQIYQTKLVRLKEKLSVKEEYLKLSQRLLDLPPVEKKPIAWRSASICEPPEPAERPSARDASPVRSKQTG
jgi:hypothetical protein